MTRTERKAFNRKRTYKLFKKTMFGITLLLGGALTSLLTGDGTAFAVLGFFAAPLLLTARKIYIK